MTMRGATDQRETPDENNIRYGPGAVRRSARERPTSGADLLTGRDHARSRVLAPHDRNEPRRDAQGDARRQANYHPHRREERTYFRRARARGRHPRRENGRATLPHGYFSRDRGRRPGRAIAASGPPADRRP